MLNIAIFASGSGTNAQNICAHFKLHRRANISLILSENSNAYALERAKQLGIPSLSFQLAELDSGKVLSILRSYKIDFLVLAGFLRLIPSEIVEAYSNRIVNIHPALLPKYGGKGMYGLKVHKAVIDAKEKETGITIHYVNRLYDEGSIIFQAKCPVLSTDTPDSLAQRVHLLEYEHYPRVIEEVLLSL